MRRFLLSLSVAIWSIATVAIAQAVVPVPSPAILAQQQATSDAVYKQLTGFDKSYALVIGISKFKDGSGWGDLPGVEAETTAIAKVLNEQHGFTIAGASQMSGKMDSGELAKRINDFVAIYGNRPDRRLVIYIATHGYNDADNPEGTGYLVTSDTDNPHDGKVEHAFSAAELDSALSNLVSQHVYIFLDSCFSGSLFPHFKQVDPTRGESLLPEGKPAEALSEGTIAWTSKLLSLYAQMMMTAGGSDEKVLDVGSPFGRAVVDALSGQADLDGDGLTLGTEIYMFVRSRVVKETYAANNQNTPIFAKLEHTRVEAGVQPDDGDFVFLTPGGASPAGIAGVSYEQAKLSARRDNLGGGQFTECIGCPTMTRLPGRMSSLAMGVTEVTFADWDACVSELGCKGNHDDLGQGRGDRPVGNVTWMDAYQFVAWLNDKERDEPDPDTDDPECLTYRLPTAQEWLFAALYDGDTDLTWRSAASRSNAICWGCGPGANGTAAVAVASAPENGAHLFDMVGNLWEWVLTDEEDMLTEGGAWPDQGDIPVGPDMLCGTTEITTAGRCGKGVVMGGSYATRAEALAQSMWGSQPRTDNDETTRWSLPTVGFRVACELKPTE